MRAGLSVWFRPIGAMILIAAPVLLSSGSAYGAGVQISLASSFNADPVLRYSGGVFTTPSISWDDATPGGGVDNWIITQSAANQLATSQELLTPAPVGINDTGFYPASGARLYDVQLGFTDSTPTGTSTAIRSNTSGSFSFAVPSGQYSQFAVFGSGGSGNSTLSITLSYSTGTPTVLAGVTLPDWYSGTGGTAAGLAGTYFALTPAMARQAAYSFPGSGYQVPNSPNGAFIYGINLAPDPTRALTNVAVAYTSGSAGYTVANFLTAAGALATPTTPTTPTTPAPPSIWLALTGLAGAGIFYALRLRSRSSNAA
jgi:hypothetical protein